MNNDDIKSSVKDSASLLNRKLQKLDPVNFHTQEQTSNIQECINELIESVEHISDDRSLHNLIKGEYDKRIDATLYEIERL